MDGKPKISVITPCKNRARFLRETIASILQQTFTDYEHVLVDGVSTDNTIEILKEYKHIRWISEPDRHADEATCKALAMARGEYIMFICVSDEYLDRDWFGKCVEILDNDPEVSLVYGLNQHIMEDGTLERARNFNLSQLQKMDFFPFWLGTFSLFPEMTYCVRADIFRKCLPKYEPDGRFLQNHPIFGFLYNFHVNGYLSYFLPVIASRARCHHDSYSITNAKEIKAMKRQYKSAIVRYANEVLSGRREHVFRNGRSNVIGAIEPQQLNLCRQSVLDYRINRKCYLDKKRTGGLRYWRRKLRILAAYFLCRRRIYN
ncbi:MAG: glycosyltransferase [Planctomycetota bacterium]